MIELACDTTRVRLDPVNGACVRAFDWRRTDGTWCPVFTEADPVDSSAAGSALFVMLPFANRVRGNRLRIADQTIDLVPNTSEPHVLHGHGWQRPWQVADCSERRCRLTLSHRPDDPVPVDASLELTLRSDGLDVTVGLHNPTDHALPVGFGLHPYFPHRANTSLEFDAARFWLEGPDHLPTDAISVPPELSCAPARALPSRGRHHCYVGWTGRARLTQPDFGYQIEMRADPVLGHLMLYTPQTDVFGLEPQSHVSGMTDLAPNGLRALDPDQALGASVGFDITPIGRDTRV